MKKMILIALLVLLTPSFVLGAFVDNGDGTVTDTVTGLMWQQATDGSMNWNEAISHCEGLTLAGYDDWRLPNRRELRSIVDYSKYNPAIDTGYFPGMLSSDYWSSTTVLDPYYGTSYALGVDFSSGGDLPYVKSNDYYVCAVRAGQSRLLDHLIISSPRQGSIWEFGDVLPIRWDTAGLGGNVEISISRQGGKSGTFTVIAAATDNDGIYDWTVASAWSPNCMLKIVPTVDTGKETVQGLFQVVAVPITCYVNQSDATCGGNSPCYTSIQAAINAESTGATILIAQGKYPEPITLNEPKTLTLSGGWNSSYETQTSNTTFIGQLTASQGSLTLGTITIKP